MHKSTAWVANPMRLVMLAVVAILLGLLSAEAGAQGSLENGGFETVVPITTDPYGHWGGDWAEIVGPTLGVNSFEGARMLQFVYANPSGPSTNDTSDVYQIVDLSSHRSLIATGMATVNVTAWFNRVTGDAETDTSFAIGILAYAGDPSTFPSQAGGGELDWIFASCLTDADPSIWQDAMASLLLPTTTDFISVHLRASENVVDDISGTEFDGHFADAVTMEIIPEPATLSLLALGLGALALRRRRKA